MEKDELLQIKVDLKSPHKDKFLELVEHWSFTTYTETIRYMITTNWDQEIARESVYLQIRQELIDQLHVLVKRRDIQEKYYSYTVVDLVNKAIEELLSEVKSNRNSIFQWDIRKRFSDDELKVTEAISQVQESRVSNDFTFDLVMRTLGWRNEDKLRRIIDAFENEGLISSIRIDKKIIYNAPPPI